MSSLDLDGLKKDLFVHLQRGSSGFGLSGSSDSRAEQEGRYKQLKNLPEDNSLSFLAHGEANVIFRLNQRQIVRVAVNTPNQRFGGDFSLLTGFEQAILNYIQGTGIGHELQFAQLQPAPDFPYTYLITNYLVGEPLNYSRAHLQQCAETLAHLHRLPLSAGYEVAKLSPLVPVIEQPLELFYQESKAYAQPYLDSAEADPAIAQMIQALLAKARSRLPLAHLLTDYPHRCLVHSDHTYENWVINDQRAYLIDWEWAEIGSPAGDLGHFLSPVTICCRQGYALPLEDRAFFLQRYYEALADEPLATAIKHHFAAFGPFPAVRSLCWTAGYWVTARRWYADADNDSSMERIRRLQESHAQFKYLCEAIIAWLDEGVAV